jgi:hypothetical protein
MGRNLANKQYYIQHLTSVPAWESPRTPRGIREPLA